MPQEITHERRLRNVDELAAEFFDRARELGGTARIVERPGGGTLVAVSFPVAS